MPTNGITCNAGHTGCYCRYEKDLTLRCPSPAEKGTIYLCRTPQGWFADLTYTDRAEEVKSAFGTATIPIPFTSSASESTVVEAMQRLGLTVAVRH